MPSKAMILDPDSQNQTAPLLVVHDSLSDTWYELDPELWMDVALQGDDPDEEIPDYSDPDIEEI